MQALIAEGLRFLKSFHPITKRILKYGLPIAFFFFMGALFFHLTAPYSTEFYQWERLKNEFFLCGKDLLTVVLLYGLTFELLQKAIALEAEK